MATRLGTHFLAFTGVLAALSVVFIAICIVRLIIIWRNPTRERWWVRLDAQVHVCVFFSALMLAFQCVDFKGLRGDIPEFYNTMARDASVASALTCLLLILRRWLSILVQTTTLVPSRYGLVFKILIVAQWICFLILDILEFDVVPPLLQAYGYRWRIAIGAKFVFLAIVFLSATIFSLMWGTRILLALERSGPAVPQAAAARKPKRLSQTPSSLGFLATYMPSSSSRSTLRGETSLRNLNQRTGVRRTCGCCTMSKRGRKVMRSVVMFTLLPLLTCAYDVWQASLELGSCQYKITVDPGIAGFYAQYSIYLLVAACIVVLWLFAPGSDTKPNKYQQQHEMSTSNPVPSNFTPVVVTSGSGSEPLSPHPE